MYNPENIPTTHVVDYKGQIYPEPPKTSGKPEFMHKVEYLRKKGKKLLAIKKAAELLLVDGNSTVEK